MDAQILADKAKAYLAERMDEIDRLHSQGLYKEIEMGNKSSQIVVTYPPVQTLSTFDGRDILRKR